MAEKDGGLMTSASGFGVGSAILVLAVSEKVLIVRVLTFVMDPGPPSKVRLLSQVRFRLLPPPSIAPFTVMEP